MTPHTQTILADREDGHSAAGLPGNCIQVAVASMLDLELDDVPHFAVFVDWFAAMRRWARTRDGDFTYFPFPVPEQYAEGWAGIQEWGREHQALVLLSGPSPRGPFWHVVVGNVDLEVVHDPHPSRAVPAPPQAHLPTVRRQPRPPVGRLERPRPQGARTYRPRHPRPMPGLRRPEVRPRGLPPQPPPLRPARGVLTMARPLPPHPDAAHQAITTELVRLSLGGRPNRPELTSARWLDWDRLEPRRPIPRRTQRKRR